MTSNTDLQHFLKFVVPTKGTSTTDIQQRFEHWIEAANYPERFTGDDTSPSAHREMRRKARQNLRRLALRHPDIAKRILQAKEAA